MAGISYGGIQSMSLARLRDRIRLPNGSFRRWRSPKGTALRIAAAYPRWGAFDLTYSLQPNGHFLDSEPFGTLEGIRPGGVSKQSYNNILYSAGNALASMRRRVVLSGPTSPGGRR